MALPVNFLLLFYDHFLANTLKCFLIKGNSHLVSQISIHLYVSIVCPKDKPEIFATKQKPMVARSLVSTPYISIGLDRLNSPSY